MLAFLFGLAVGASIGLMIGCLLGSIRDPVPEFDDWGPPEKKP